MSDDWMEVLARRCGFKDLGEMNRMVAAVNLAEPEMIVRFKEWQILDGTRAGLEKLLEL